ncbi:hypothetical protein [Mucilaginibacter phyllosphaerae]
MDKHYGQIVELVIRKGEYSISEIARLTSTNRKSIYNWFNQKYLKPEIIFKIGNFIGHDFSVEFPELFTADQFNNKNDATSDKSTFGATTDSPDSDVWKDKYILLLEKYNELLLKRLEEDRSLL